MYLYSGNYGTRSMGYLYYIIDKIGKKFIGIWKIFFKDGNLAKLPR